MQPSSETPQNESTYVLDPESAAEMARLLDQDLLATKHMGGLLTERPDFANIHRVLDIACGPGGWVQEVAFTHPEIEVIGIDISQAMIQYARAQMDVSWLLFYTHPHGQNSSRSVDALPDPGEPSV